MEQEVNPNLSKAREEAASQRRADGVLSSLRVEGINPSPKIVKKTIEKCRRVTPLFRPK